MKRIVSLSALCLVAASLLWPAAADARIPEDKRAAFEPGAFQLMYRKYRGADEVDDRGGRGRGGSGGGGGGGGSGNGSGKDNTGSSKSSSGSAGGGAGSKAGGDKGNPSDSGDRFRN